LASAAITVATTTSAGAAVTAFVVRVVRSTKGGRQLAEGQEERHEPVEARR
jgi:hypothetical protein